jgi:CubicO group peptidase (beta-lactamase class C family)
MRMQRNLKIVLMATALAGLLTPACGGNHPSAAAVSMLEPFGDGDSSDAGDAAVSSSPGDAGASVIPPGLDALVLAKMQVARVPGLVAVVVKGDRVLLSRGYGMANLAEGRAVTPDTLFNVASISKTFLSVAIEQLVESGAIALDDDIGEQLAFSARNPSFPDDALTYRMLLAHTSSLLDTPEIFGDKSYGENSPIRLSTFLRGYVEPGGTYYRRRNWSATTPPGSAFAYSNAGSGLAGLFIENVAGIGLEAYSRDNIFAPLGMTRSSWFLDGLDLADVAMPYTLDAAGSYEAAGYYCYPDYPSGQLRTSGSELARFLMMVIQGGQLDGAKVLSPTSVAEMEAQQPHSYEGLSWEYNVVGGHSLVGHWGVDVGVSTDMWLDPSTGAGYITLTNGDVYDAHYANFESNGPYVPAVQAMIDIGAALLDVAESD